MIKIGIDPSGTGTTAIVIYEDNKIDIKEFNNCEWLGHYFFIKNILTIYKEYFLILNIENCLYTNANGSKDRDNLLKLLGAIEVLLTQCKLLLLVPHFNWVSPKHTKSVVKNIENLSKYNNGCIQEFSKDDYLTYECGKGWKYNNEKISNHLRDAIIIANYEGK